VENMYFLRNKVQSTTDACLSERPVWIEIPKDVGVTIDQEMCIYATSKYIQ